MERMLSDPEALRRLMQGGDRLAYCQGLGWRLVAADRPVAPEVVEDLTACLEPLGDALFHDEPAQTYAWRQDVEAA